MIFRQVFFYLIVGLITAGVDVGLVIVLLKFNFHLLTSVSIGYLTGVLFNFFTQAIITFNSNVSGKRLLKYLTVVAINYFLTLIIILVFKKIGLSPLVGKIFSLPIVAIFGFYLSKKWIYK